MVPRGCRMGMERAAGLAERSDRLVWGVETEPKESR